MALAPPSAMEVSHGGLSCYCIQDQYYKMEISQVLVVGDQGVCFTLRATSQVTPLCLSRIACVYN